MAGPKAPSGLGRKAKALWSEVTDNYDLRVDELRILEDACWEADLVDRLQSEINAADHENVVKGSMGQPVASPLVQEVRQHRTVLARLLTSLKLPEDEAGQAAGRSAQMRQVASARWQRGA